MQNFGFVYIGRKEKNNLNNRVNTQKVTISKLLKKKKIFF